MRIKKILLTGILLFVISLFLGQINVAGVELDKEEGNKDKKGFEDLLKRPDIQGRVLVRENAEGLELTKDAKEPESPQYVPGEVIVKFKKGVTDIPAGIQALNKKYKLKKIEKVFKDKPQAQSPELKAHLEQRQKRAPKDGLEKAKALKEGFQRIYRLTFDKEADIEAVIQDYQNDPNAEYAEPNYIVSVQAIPNDPYYSSSGSWGQAYDDLWGLKKIGADKAWDTSQGEGIVVAVIDTGVDYTHEDLSENIWTNAKETPDNGIDDDVNGFVDDIRGWDCTTCEQFSLLGCDKPKLQDNDPLDGFGHGTHVSGTIAAVGNNYKGIIGVSPKARIMPVKGLNDLQGAGSLSDLAKAVRYAVDNGADVISNSWGAYAFGGNQFLTETFHYAYYKGCVVVAAAGNSRSYASFFTPAGIDTVITVAASTQKDEKCDFSNYGEKIDVSAPGGGYVNELGRGSDDKYNILSTMPENSTITHGLPYFKISNGYWRLAGTSMACPHVSGVAALILSKFPGISNDTVRAIINSTADDIGEPSFDILTGNGRINAYNALKDIQVKFNKKRYLTEDKASIIVIDTAKNLNPDIKDTLRASVKSDSYVQPIMLTLTEDGENSGVFTGTFTVSDEDTLPSNTLPVKLRDSIYVEYISSAGPTLTDKASINISTVTFLKEGNGVKNALIAAFDVNDNLLEFAYTDLSGKAYLSLKEGIQVKFRAYYGIDFAAESYLTATPANITLTVPQPTVVTVLKDGIGLKDVGIFPSYGGNIFGNWGYSTDSSGKVCFYLKESMQVKFEAISNKFISSTDYFTTPADITISLKPTTVTVLKDGIGVVAGVYAYDINRVSLGNGRVFTDASGKANFYINEGTQVKFEVYYLNPFLSAETDYLTAPTNVTITLPQPSVVTVLKNGVGVQGAVVDPDYIDVGYGGLTTDSSGKAYFYLKEGMQVKFKVRYQGFSTETDYFTAPTNVTVILPQPTVVTVLKDGIGVSYVGISAYDTNGAKLTDASTDSSGKAYFYLKEGMQVKFKVYYSGSSTETGYFTTPANVNVTVTLPKPTVVTVLKGGVAVSYGRVDAYDTNGVDLGGMFLDSSGKAYFYLKEGMQVKFAVLYIESSVETDYFTVPANVTITLAQQPTVVTVLKDGVGLKYSCWIGAYDIDGVRLGSTATNSSGKAELYIKEGTQVKFKVYYQTPDQGFLSAETDYFTTPSNVTVSLPQFTLVTVINSDGLSLRKSILVRAYDTNGVKLGEGPTDPFSGRIAPYLKEGMQVKFEAYYPGSYQKFLCAETGYFTTPANIVITLRPTVVTVLKDGITGMGGIEVVAYDKNGVKLESAPTDSSGKANFYLKEGTEVKFKVSYGNLVQESEYITTPGEVFISFNNHSPELSLPFTSENIKEGDPVNFTISATDPDGDYLIFVHPLFSDLPQGATFVDNHNGTGTFRWTPDYTQGRTEPYVIHFEVSDGSLPDSEDVAITVNNVLVKGTISEKYSTTVFPGSDPKFTRIRPSQGALVTLLTQDRTELAFATTDSQGKFELSVSGIPDEQYPITATITVIKNGYESYTATVTLVNNQVLMFLATLTPSLSRPQVPTAVAIE